MDWWDRLRRKIEAICDDEWDYDVRWRDGMRTERVEYQTIEIPAEKADVVGLIRSVRCVNAAALAGRPRGTVLLCGAALDGSNARLTFCVRRSAPWNHAIHPETGEWAEMMDAVGQPPYPYVDFVAIDAAPRGETWRDRAIKKPLF